MSLERPVVLVVGAASRDVAADDPRGWRLGGAVMYASLALARLGLAVRSVVGVDDAAARAAELDELSAAGATVALAELASGPVFENIETPSGRRQRCLATAGAVPLTAIPRAWTRGHDAIVLAPVAGELGAEWTALAGGEPRLQVALGWQGLLRDLVSGEDVRRARPRRDPLVAAANLVGCSRDDVAPGTNPADLALLLSPGATLLFTEGEAGGQVLRGGPTARPDERSEPERYEAIPSDATVDPTGAGDVFLATMLAGLLQPGLGASSGVFAEPTRLAAAAASLTVEAPGLAGVPDLAAVRRRLTRAPSLASRRPSATSSRESGRPSQA